MACLEKSVVICLVILSLSYAVSAQGILTALNFHEHMCNEKEYLLTITKKVVCLLCNLQLSCLLPSNSNTASPPSASPNNDANKGNQGNQGGSSNQGGKPGSGGGQPSAGGGKPSAGGKPSTGPRGRRSIERSYNEESNTDQENN